MIPRDRDAHLQRSRKPRARWAALWITGGAAVAGCKAWHGRPPGLVPTRRVAWQCAEWALDPANQSFHLYLNGNEVFGFTNGAGQYANSDIPDAFTSLKVGETHYQNSQSGFVVQFDELVIDSRRVGCN